MNVRLIVPRRRDGGHRDRLWEWCRAQWAHEFPTWDIVEGHHDQGPFNRSAAINRAAAGAWDMAVIIDSDVIVDPDQVRAGIARAARSGGMVLPFRRRVSLTEQGTREVLGGASGSWKRWTAETQTYNVSTCVIVGRDLFDHVGGFDERFEGWGGEDDAFWAACKALGGVDRITGDAWHLWHPVSRWRDHTSGLYRQARALAERYRKTTDPTAMTRLLAEPRTADQTVLVVLTTGTRPTLPDTIASADANLIGPISRRLLVVDNRHARDVRWARTAAPGWDVVPVRGGGYGRAVRAGLDLAIGSGQPWVFWLEDDFTFNDVTYVSDLQECVDRHELAQLSLLRQPWYPDEVAAGGIIEANPHQFHQADGHVQHRAYWTMNPMLVRRRFLAEHPWPAGPASERRFGEQLFTDHPMLLAGIWGHRDDSPRVTHHGTVRAGIGY